MIEPCGCCEGIETVTPESEFEPAGPHCPSIPGGYSRHFLRDHAGAAFEPLL